jgi:hypothetical protein
VDVTQNSDLKGYYISFDKYGSDAASVLGLQLSVLLERETVCERGERVGD